jgi:hypothetical protein
MRGSLTLSHAWRVLLCVFFTPSPFSSSVCLCNSRCVGRTRVWHFVCTEQSVNYYYYITIILLGQQLPGICYWGFRNQKTFVWCFLLNIRITGKILECNFSWRVGSDMSTIQTLRWIRTRQRSFLRWQLKGANGEASISMPGSTNPKTSVFCANCFRWKVVCVRLSFTPHIVSHYRNHHLLRVNIRHSLL